MTLTRERLYITWIGAWDRSDHAVTDEECASRLADNRGVYRAVCAAEFLPTTMESAPQPPCSRCLAVIRARWGMPEARTPGAPRRRGLSSRPNCSGRG